MGDPQTFRGGDLSPDQAAQRHRSEDDGEENRETPRPNPGRQGDLGGYVETGEHDRPGGARQQRRGASHARKASETKKRQPNRDADCSKSDDPIGAELLLQPGERERADYRANAHRRQKDAINFRPPRHLMAGYERKQRQKGAGERVHGDGPNQRGSQMLVIDSVPQSGADRARQSLGGQIVRSRLRRAPPQQGGDRSEIGGAENPIRRRGSKTGNGHSGNHGADGAAEAIAHAAGGGGAVEVGSRHEERRDRQPGRRRQGPARAQQEDGREQIGRGIQVKKDHRREHADHGGDERLHHDQKSAGLDDVRERACGQREQEHRQTARDLHHRHCPRGGIEIRHQPCGSRVGHRDAGQGERARSPNHRKGRVAERSKAGAPAFRRIDSSDRGRAHEMFPFVLVATAPTQKRRLENVVQRLSAQGLVFVRDVGLQTANSKSPGSSNPSRASDRF